MLQKVMQIFTVIVTTHTIFPQQLQSLPLYAWQAVHHSFPLARKQVISVT